MSTKAGSILARIDARGRVVPRVHLKDLGGDETAVTEIELRATGRYEVLGQIAEGGIGRVLKGRDTDLGRDVAMKVLREDRMGSVDMLQRFVEEAQIGGQLQHPGIVPVYELGLHDGRQPYFAMKLVKGRTLSALLEDRHGPADRRRHFLSIFLQVCQTIAYAHSRNVIHRDLKPANVMVGSFGEVQVVDWGFAKVLREGGVADERRASRTASDLTHVATLRSAGEGSESIAGSVMGTPAYMPPEQALGHVDELDQRSDVFSLGAILCEILTGGPVHLGPAEDLLMKAAKGQTDDALARLDECGADPGIVQLAKSCIARLRADRPRDAAVLAHGVGEHLASAEERAQKSKLRTIESRKKMAATQAAVAQAKAKLEAARAEAEKRKAQAERTRRQADRAQAEAEEARRSRRQLRILAAAVLVALSAGGGAYAWVVAGRRAEAREVDARVHGELAAARRLKGEGRWGEARAAAKRAAAEAPGAEQAEATALIEAIDTEEKREEAENARLAKDRAFVHELEEMRARGTDGIEALRADAAFAAAFRGHGIDLGKLDAADAARRIRRIEGWRRVAEALDDRLWLRGGWVDLKGGDRGKLVEVLKAVDSDAWRDRLRDARGEGLPHVQSLVEEMGQENGLPAHTLLLAATALGAAGDAGGALRLLEAAHRDHPDNPWLALRIATYLGELGRTTEALRYYGGVLALLPHNLFVRLALARDLRRDGKVDEAVAFSQETLRLHPDSAHAHLGLGIALFGAGKRSEGDEEYGKAAELAPGEGWVHDDWGAAVGEMNDGSRRVKAWREALRVEPGVAHFHAQLGSELASTGDYEAGIAELRHAVSLEPAYYGGWLSLGLVLAAANRQDESLEATRKAVSLREQDWRGQEALGYALQRKGERDASLDAFRKAAELAPGQATVHVMLGDALLREGKVGEAVKSFFRAIKIDNTDVTLTAVGIGLRASGEMGQAEIAAREALALNPEYVDAQVLLGRVFLERGKIDDAIKELDKAIGMDAQSAAALLEMGYAHYRRSDARKALEYLQRAYEANPESGAALVAIGRARELQGDVARAREAYERALTKRPPSATGYEAARAGCQLGLLLMRKGKFDEALPVLREADTLAQTVGYWDLPSDVWVESCAAMVALAPRLPGVRDGSYTPADAAEKAHLARMCSLLRHDDVAVRLFSEAFAADPDLAYVSTGNRLHAARSAARLAAAGDAAARREALAWLQAEVKDRAEQLWDIYPTARAWAREVLLDLRLDADLAAWRAGERLATIPEAERGAWRAVWAEVDVALDRPSK